MSTPVPSSMDGKVVLITGATNGIGKVTARALAALGATVVGVGRSAERNAAAVRTIRERTGNDRVEYLLADLSSMQAVCHLAAGVFAIDVERGAQTSIYLACSADVAGTTGQYFARSHVSYSSPASHDLAAQHRLWAISARIAGLDDASLPEPSQPMPEPALLR